MQDSPVSETHFSKTCAFCKIIRSEEKAYIVFEDGISLAFLERRPLFPGHCLLVPKDHDETLADLPASLVGPLFQNAQLLERAIEEGLQADGTFIAINNRVSQSVPHVHIHLVPRHRNDGLRGFFWPRQHYKDEAALPDWMIDRVLPGCPRLVVREQKSSHPVRQIASKVALLLRTAGTPEHTSEMVLSLL